MAVALGVVVQAEQHAQAGRVDEVDLAEVDDDASESSLDVFGDRLLQLADGIQIEFADRNQRDLVAIGDDRDRDGVYGDDSTPLMGVPLALD